MEIIQRLLTGDREKIEERVSAITNRIMWMRKIKHKGDRRNRKIKKIININNINRKIKILLVVDI